jgi:hypothetical protein
LVAKFLSFCAQLYTHNWCSFHPTCIRLILRSSLFSKLYTLLLLSLVQNPSSRVQISNTQRISDMAKKVIDYSMECIQKAANGSLHSFIQTMLHSLWAPSESLLQEKLRVFWLSILSKNVVFTMVYWWITTAFLLLFPYKKPLLFLQDFQACYLNQSQITNPTVLIVNCRGLSVPIWVAIMLSNSIQNQN